MPFIEHPPQSILCAACTAAIPRPQGLDAACPHCTQNPALNQRYFLEKILGQGASGTTFLAHDTQTGDRVAIKEILLSQVRDIKALALFEREAEALKRIQFPGVPSYFDSFTVSHGRRIGLYTVMEYIEGENLETYRQKNALSLKEIIETGATIAGILAHLHHLAPPIIHRDLKPSNIMRRPDGSLVLIDFGAVKDSVKGLGSTTMAGTVGYMPLEQFAGHATPQSDLYALGATMVALATQGELSHLIDIQNRLNWRPHIPPDSPMAQGLSALLEQLLSPQAQDRPDSASDVQIQLRQLSTRSDRRRAGHALSPDGSPAPPGARPLRTQQRITWPPHSIPLPSALFTWSVATGYALILSGLALLSTQPPFVFIPIAIAIAAAIGHALYKTTPVFKSVPVTPRPAIVTDISRYLRQDKSSQQGHLYLVRYTYHDDDGQPFEGVAPFQFYDVLDERGKPVPPETDFPLQVGQEVLVYVGTQDPAISQLDWDGRDAGFDPGHQLMTPKW